MNKTNPFDWGVIENREYKSIFTQKNATYNEPAQETFTGNEVGSFFFNEQAPTHRLRPFVVWNVRRMKRKTAEITVTNTERIYEIP